MKSSIRITDNGNTIHATGDAASTLLQMLTEPLKEQARHIHINNSLNDSCKECGKDLRDEIHSRQLELKP